MIESHPNPSTARGFVSWFPRSVGSLVHRGHRRRGLVKQTLLALAYFALCAASLFAQDQSQQAQVININISRSIQAVKYRAKGSTRIDFRGTALLPRAKGRYQDREQDLGRHNRGQLRQPLSRNAVWIGVSNYLLIGA